SRASAAISSSPRASARAARTGSRCPSASACRRCASTASPSAARRPSKYGPSRPGGRPGRARVCRRRARRGRAGRRERGTVGRGAPRRSRPAEACAPAAGRAPRYRRRLDRDRLHRRPVTPRARRAPPPGLRARTPHRASWYTAHRKLDALDAPASVGREAARRAVRRLGARRVPTGEYPVVFDPETAASLLRHLAGAIAGPALYRRVSFLLGKLGEAIASPHVSIEGAPLRPAGSGSRPCEGEGVASRRLAVVDAGVLRSYLLDAYSARRLGLQPTGHAARSFGDAPGAGPAGVLFFLVLLVLVEIVVVVVIVLDFTLVVDVLVVFLFLFFVLFFRAKQLAQKRRCTHPLCHAGPLLAMGARG